VTELRNRIYDIIIADPHPKTVNIHHARRGRSIAASTYFRDQHLSRPYLAFTQVNHVFRKEFTPLYVAAIKPVVQIQDARKYLEVFGLPDEELAQQLADVSRALSKMKGSTKGPRVDILPLLKVDWCTFPFTIYNEHLHPSYLPDALIQVYRLLKSFAHLDPDSKPIGPELQTGDIEAVHISRLRYTTPAGWSKLGEIITLEMSEEFNEDIDEHVKSHVFTEFVERRGWSNVIRVECVSGLTKMVATYGRPRAKIDIETSRPAKRKLCV
jgi:hypothetical protein